MPRVCPVCHRESTVESDFCPACGAPMDEHVLNGQAKAAARAQEQPPMKWHKFLTWFILPVSLIMAVVGLIGAWQDLQGFDATLFKPEYVSMVRLTMQLSLIVEMALIPLSALAMFFMWGMKWTGVRLVLMMYAIQLIYALIGLGMLLRMGADPLEAAVSVFTAVCILALTWIYYRKRKKLFE